MNEIIIMMAVLLMGAVLGGFYFGGLWWTVRKGVATENPALWFLGSSLLRTGVVLAGFYFVARGDWEKLLVCLLGFVIARLAIMRFTRTNKKANHAP